MRRIAAVAVAVLAVTAVLVLGAAAPASAHAADAPSATDYRTRLTAVTPAVDGLRVRAVENGARLEVRNGTGRPVEVLGYSGEPYLRITDAGVWSNTGSPAHWVNATADGKTVPPADADVDVRAAPRWVKVASAPVIRWHDHRTHWMGSGLPPSVRRDPGQARRLSEWRVALVAGDAPVAVTGTLDYLPPPRPALWWAGTVALAGLVTALVLASGRRRTWVLGAVLLVAAGAELADDVGRAVDTGAHGAGILAALFVDQTAGPAMALGTIAAAVFALRGRDAGIFAAALAGACLAVVGGLPDVTVFAHSVAPVPWGGVWSRLTAAAVLGVGAGVAAGGWLALRSVRPVRVPAPRRDAIDRSTLSP